METLCPFGIAEAGTTKYSLYSLEKLIEWKPGRVWASGAGDSSSALYSLEKLIEWKLQKRLLCLRNLRLSLYSLEKLIEWKLANYQHISGLLISSLLAREIN